MNVFRILLIVVFFIPIFAFSLVPKSFEGDYALLKSTGSGIGCPKFVRIEYLVKENELVLRDLELSSIWRSFDKVGERARLKNFGIWPHDKSIVEKTYLIGNALVSTIIEEYAFGPYMAKSLYIEETIVEKYSGNLTYTFSDKNDLTRYCQYQYL